MSDLIIGLLKASVCLPLFYGAYFLLFRRMKAPVFNRFYLSGSLLLCLALSFWPPALPAITAVSPASQVLTMVPKVTAELPAAAETFSPSEHAAFLTPLMFALLIWITVSAALLLRFLVRLSRMLYRIARADKIRDGSEILILCDDTEHLPYSFLHCIFVSREAWWSGRMDDAVLSHERAHSRQGHSFDLMLSELMIAMLWFHPVVYGYRRDIRLNCEYLADDSALRQCESRHYQRILLHSVEQLQAPALVSHFSKSFTKNRLIMMTKLRTKKIHIALRTFLIAPVLFLAFLLSAEARSDAGPPVDSNDGKKEVEEEVEHIREAFDKEAAGKQIIIEKELREVSDREAADKVRKEVVEKRAMIVNDSEGNPQDQHQQIEELLERELENLDIDLEDLDLDLENLEPGEDGSIRLEIEKMIDGVEHKICIVAKDIEREVKDRIRWKTGDEDDEEELDMDIDIEFDENDDLYEIEKDIRDGEREHRVMVITDDDEVIRLEGGEQKVIILKDGDEEHVIELKGDDDREHSYRIVIESDDDGGRRKRNRKR